MKQLLRFEFRKLFQSKAFYICVAISIAFILITALTMKLIPEDLKNATPGLQTSYTGLTMLKDVYNNGSISILGGVMIAILVTEDFGADTLKNVYARGYTRQNVFYAKAISALTAFLCMLLVDMLLSLLFGSVLFDGFGVAGTNYALAFIATIFLSLAYFSIFFTVSYLFRKLSLGITFCIVIPMATSLLLVLVDTVIANINKDWSISNYWLDGRLAQMARLDVAGGDIAGAFVISILVIASMTLLISLVNRKRDA